MEASTLSTIYQGLSVVGSAVSAIGQISAGRSAVSVGKAEQKAYDYNASIAIQKAKFEEEQSRERFERLKGRQRALFGKAGVDISSGSPLVVLADTAYQEEDEAEMIRRGGQNEAAMQRYYGSLMGFRGKQAESQAWIGGMSTFLTGLGRAGLTYLKNKPTGSEYTQG